MNIVDYIWTHPSCFASLVGVICWVQFWIARQPKTASYPIVHEASVLNRFVNCPHSRFSMFTLHSTTAKELMVCIFKVECFYETNTEKERRRDVSGGQKNIAIFGFQHNDDMMREWEVWLSFYKYDLNAQWSLTTNVSTLHLSMLPK